MKKFIVLIVLILSQLLQAGVKDLESFEANFTQVITNPNGKQIVYQGMLYAIKNNVAVLNYNKPIKKIIYYIHNEVMIVEPELEQVVVTKMQDNQNLLSILNKSQEIEKNHFIADCCGAKYHIYFQENLGIQKIEYQDRLGNFSVINFTKQKLNQKIDDKLFHPDIPEEFDIIRK